MFNTRKAALGLAIVFGAVLAVPVLADGASDFQVNVAKAQGTLNDMTKLFDGMGKHEAADSGSSGAVRVADAAGDTYKCPACGMMMPMKPSGNLTRAVMYGGKTYYCCSGCDMSKTADKATGKTPGGKKPGKKPAKKTT